MKAFRPKNSTTDTAAPEKGQAFLFSSGALFFTHVIEWPEGVKEAELASLAELCLEDISPFSLESLAWGFCSDATSRTVFLYAACLPRIPAAELEQWPAAEHVYPAFLPLLAERIEGAGAAPLPARELLVLPREVLLIERAEGSRWPHRIMAEPIDPQTQGNPQEVIAAALRLLQKATGGCATVRQQLDALPLWQLQGSALGRGGQLRFTLQRFDAVQQGGAVADAADGSATVAASRVAAAGGSFTGGRSMDAAATGGSAGQSSHGQSREVAAAPGFAELQGGQHSSGTVDTVLQGEDTLWQADLRTEAFIAQARQRRLMGVRLWYGLCAAAAAAVLLLLMLLVFAWQGVVLKDRTTKLAVQAPAVERVRQDQDLLMRMRQFSADPFAPFSLIAALKESKPEAIYFDSIELNGPDSVVVEGQGPTVDAVNAYVRSLEQGGTFRSARQARMNLKDGVSVFTLYLQYTGQSASTARTQNPAAQTGDAVQKAPAAAATVPAAANSVAASSGSRRSAQPAATPVAEDWDIAMSSEVVVTRIENPVVTTGNTGGAVVVGAQQENAVVQEPAPRGAWAQHRVAAGETLGDLAEFYGVPISAILDANPNLDPTAMEAGQSILINFNGPPPLPED